MGGEYGVVNDSLHREGPEPAIVQGYVMGGKEELGAARAALLVALEIAAGLALERAPAAAQYTLEDREAARAALLEIELEETRRVAELYGIGPRT